MEVLSLYALRPNSWVLERLTDLPWVLSAVQAYPSGTASEIWMLETLTGNRNVIKTRKGLIDLDPAEV
jgi:hypothetical protein